MNLKSKSKAKQKDEIRLLLAEHQLWICPISGKEFKLINGRVIDPTTGKAPPVDHCHKTGLIRGLLIQKVNWLIDQWENYDAYGMLEKPRQIINYQLNPPAFDAIGKVMYNDYWK